MGLIASSCAFSVPVMSHFVALNICQTWNILNARLISHAWGVRHPLICPLFFASLSKRSPQYFVDWARWKNFSYPSFGSGCVWWDVIWCLLETGFSSWCRASLLTECSRSRGTVGEESVEGANTKHTFSVGTMRFVPKENTALNFPALLFRWVTSVRIQSIWQ